MITWVKGIYLNELFTMGIQRKSNQINQKLNIIKRVKIQYQKDRSFIEKMQNPAYDYTMSHYTISKTKH